MTLAEYLKSTGERPAQFAARIGVSRQNVSRWVAGKNLPRVAEIKRIVEATDGKVDGNSFLHQDSTGGAA
jgi:transcriptional regulator with XRE-family HTH domain